MAGDQTNDTSNKNLDQYFGDSGGANESATDRRARLRAALRNAGFDIPMTNNELLDEIGRMMDTHSPYPTSADAVTQTPYPTGAAAQGDAFEAKKQDYIDKLIAAYVQSQGGGGRVFRPSVMQQPSQRDLFNATEQAALGPAPDLLFRDVFNEAFPALGQGEGPFEKFAQKQAGDLEKQFMTGVFQQFNEPGFMDALRGDYEKLYRTKEQGDFNGAGGSIPAFEDFIKGRIRGDYRTFLESQRGNLRKAFELASPDERGQRDANSLAPQSRIL